MVANHLGENPTIAPFDLEPLIFKLNNRMAFADDVNPLLIATEFALQGKTVLISDSSSKHLSHDIRLAMLKLGVPSNRITIAASLPEKAESIPNTLSIGLKIL